MERFVDPECERETVAELQATRSRLAEVELRLQQLSDRDPLTGLLSRRRFREVLERQLESPGSEPLTGSVVLLDLDNFRFVNDAYGYSHGDDVLRAVGRMLTGQVGGPALIARLGGDEFAILLTGIDGAAAVEIANRVIECFRDRISFAEGSRVSLTTSVGIASFGSAGEGRADRVLAAADRALGDAKASGRDRYSLAAENREITAYETRLGWEARIRTALATDGFSLYMQPIIELETRRTVMYEVLLRMEGERGLINPGAFLGVAEQQGLIHEIDRWVVARALDLLEADPGLVLAVNISSRSLDDARLMELIRRRLVSGRIKVNNFVIEVTETATIGDIGRAHDFAVALGALGCGLALDDFGTRFGSLSHLKSIPAGYLKIDGDFVRGPRSHTDYCVIEAIVSLARGLGKKTIAEYVEDDATLDELDRAGVDFAQGFHVGRPGPIDDFLHRIPTG